MYSRQSGYFLASSRLNQRRPVSRLQGVQQSWRWIPARRVSRAGAAVRRRDRRTGSRRVGNDAATRSRTRRASDVRHFRGKRYSDSGFSNDAGETGDEESSQGPGRQLEYPPSDGEKVARGGSGDVAGAVARPCREERSAEVDADTDSLDDGARGSRNVCRIVVDCLV
jgi:hypothetical protein